MKNSVKLIGFYCSDELIACIVEDKNLNFNLGNVVKYVARAGKKDKSKKNSKF